MTDPKEKEKTQAQEMYSNLEQCFNDACKRIISIKTSPSNKDVLILYGLYKQVKEGNCNTPQPWSIQIEARAKWDAWYKNNNMDRLTAMRNYIDKVEELMSTEQ